MTDWYVNPDAVGAGDGTSEADAYTTLAAAETAKQADITGTESVVFLCSATGDTADSTSCVITGWTTDATHTITVKANTGRAHDGIYGNASGAYKLEVTDNECIDSRENYVDLDGIQFQYTFVATGANCISMSSLDAGNAINISNCIVVINSTNNGASGIVCSDTDGVFSLWNNLVYSTASKPGTGINIGAASSADIYNCTVYGEFDTNGIRETATGTVTAKNCISGNTDDDFSFGFDTVDYCASDDGDGTNSVAPSGASWANEFTTPGSVFTVKDTSANIYHGGLDQDSDALIPATDIVGTTRPSGANAVSIGAFEFVAAGGSVIPKIRYYNRRRR